MYFFGLEDGCIHYFQTQQHMNRTHFSSVNYQQLIGCYLVL